MVNALIDRKTIVLEMNGKLRPFRNERDDSVSIDHFPIHIVSLCDKAELVLYRFLDKSVWIVKQTF